MTTETIHIRLWVKKRYKMNRKCQRVAPLGGLLSDHSQQDTHGSATHGGWVKEETGGYKAAESRDEK